MNSFEFFSVCVLLTLQVSWCCRGSSRPDTYSAQTIKKAPIYLTYDQYARLKETRTQITVKNIPPEAKRYTIHGGDEYLGASGLLNNGTKTISAPMLHLEKLDVLFITLYKSSSGGAESDTKPIVNIIKLDNQKDTATKGALVGDPMGEWVEICCKTPCTIEVDWQDTWNGSFNKTANKLPRRINRSWWTDLWNWFSSDPKRPDPVIFASNAEIKKAFELGNEVAFTCYSKDEGTTIEWTQWTGNKETYNSTPIPTDEHKIILNLEQFDDETTLKCKVTPKNGTEAKYASYEIKLSKEDLKPVPALDINLTEIYYNEETSVHFNCSFHNNPRQTYWAWQQGEKTKIVMLNETDMEMNFYKKDSGSIIFCIYFIETTLQEIRRFVGSKTRLIYNKNIPIPPPNPSPWRYGKDPYLYYYIGVASVIGLIIVLILIILTFKKLCKTKQTPLLKEERKDGVVGDKSQTLYAELELSSLPKSNRMPEINESPYAEITNPNAILYAQLDLKDGNRTVETEESPYAKILNFSPTSYKKCK